MTNISARPPAVPSHGTDTEVMPPDLVDSLLDEVERRANTVPRPRVGASLESMPRICDMVTAIRGYPEFRDHMKRVIPAESDRVHRQGFPPAVSEELMFLFRLYVDHHGLVARGAGPFTISGRVMAPGQQEVPAGATASRACLGPERNDSNAA